jgi:prepilin-type N-terminal cleavage/methylation domain-containing protein
MKINKLGNSSKSSAQAGFSLVEVTIGMGVIGTAAMALFSGFTSGFFTMQLARENLRATQVLLEKTETLRLYSWDQINTPGFIPPNFSCYYDPNDTNDVNGIIYSGTMQITNCPVSSSYSDDMRMAVITLNWHTGALPRTRTFTTYIARNGLQTYIY